MIKDGSKRQTIRGKRKAQAKPGSTVYLYYGMRTKWCTKIGESECIDVKEIVITADEKVFIDGHELSYIEKCELAYFDGFRLTDKPRTAIGCWPIMLRWWQQTNGLPFEGDVIYWGDLKK